MGLMLVLGWRIASWPSLLPVLEGPGLLLLPKSPTLHVHFPREGRTCPHPLGQMQTGHPVAVSSEAALALHSSSKELKTPGGPYRRALCFGVLKGLGWACGGEGAAGTPLMGGGVPSPQGTNAPSFTHQLWLEPTCPAAQLRPRGVPPCWSIEGTPTRPLAQPSSSASADWSLA